MFKVETIKNYYKNNKTNFWINVISSTISAAIVALIIKGGEILAFLIQLAPRAGQSLWGGIVDYIYRCAANQSQVSSLNYIFIIIFSFLVGVLYRLTRDTIQGKDTWFKVQEIFVEKSLYEDPICKKFFDEEIEKTLKRFKQLEIIFCILLLLAIFYFIYFPVCKYFSSKIYYDYKIDIIQISPYTSEQDIKMLNSNWVSMDGKADYDVIYEKINQIKKENNLTSGK